MCASLLYSMTNLLLKFIWRSLITLTEQVKKNPTPKQWKMCLTNYGRTMYAVSFWKLFVFVMSFFISQLSFQDSLECTPTFDLSMVTLSVESFFYTISDNCPTFVQVELHIIYRKNERREKWHSITWLKSQKNFATLETSSNT